jgi:transcription elongation factor Elf1
MKTTASVVAFPKSTPPVPFASSSHAHCPRCHRGKVVRMVVKAQSSPFDWFVCERCNKIISTRSPFEPGPQAA